MVETPPTETRSDALAALSRLAAAAGKEEARELARTLDGFVPATEAQWKQYHGALKALDLRSEDEIMTLKFLARCPEAAMPRLNYAAILMHRQKRAEARIQVNIVLTRPEPAMEYWVTVSSCLWRLANWNQLLEASEAGLLLHPTSFRLQYNLAAALFHLGKLERAAAASEGALTRAGNNIVLCLELADFADRNPVSNIGEKAFARALDIAADSGDAADWRKLVAFLRSRNDQTRADQLCRRAVVTVRDVKILRDLFQFAWTAAAPAVAAEIGMLLQSSGSGGPKLAEKLAVLNGRINNPNISELWWKSLRR